MSDLPLAAPQSDELAHTAKILAAFVGHNALNATDVAKAISDVHGALRSLSQPAAPLEAKPAPAVNIRKSVTPDFIVCLDDGKKFKSLKRHISLLGMTPDQYRAKWGLPSDYPMVAPNYSATRSGLAKSFGLGRKPETKVAPPRRARKAK